MNYWEECIKEAFEDAGINATEEQIQNVAGWVEGAFDNHGLATGAEFIPNPMETEVRALEGTIKKMEDANIEEVYQSGKKLERAMHDKNDIIYDLNRLLEAERNER